MRSVVLLLVAGGALLWTAVPLNAQGSSAVTEAAPLSQERVDPRALWRQSELLVATGQYSQARELLQRMLAEDRENPHVWYLLGKVAELRGDLEEAQVAYGQTLALAPGYPELSRVLMAHSRGDALPIWDPRRQKKSLPKAAPAAQNPIPPQDGASRHAVALGVEIPLLVGPGAEMGPLQAPQPMVPPVPVAPPSGAVVPRTGTAAPGAQAPQPMVPPAPVAPPSGAIVPWTGAPSPPPKEETLSMDRPGPPSPRPRPDERP